MWDEMNVVVEDVGLVYAVSKDVRMIYYYYYYNKKKKGKTRRYFIM